MSEELKRLRIEIETFDNGEEGVIFNSFVRDFSSEPMIKDFNGYNDIDQLFMDIKMFLINDIEIEKKEEQDRK